MKLFLLENTLVVFLFVALLARCHSHSDGGIHAEKSSSVEVRDGVEKKHGAEDVGPLTGANSSTTTTTTTVATTTTPAVHVIENPDVFGCRWPADFITRYTYCAKQADLQLGNITTEADLKYGVLSRDIFDQLASSCADEKTLEKCVDKVDDAKLTEFVDKWRTNVDKLPKFQQCLQSNTEALGRLCGPTQTVSKVFSGQAGLHLNLMNIMVRMYQEQLESQNAKENITDHCMRKVAESIHITAALYVQSKEFMENSIFCWEVTKRQCTNAACAAFASQLNCLQSACSPALSPSVLQDLASGSGITLTRLVPVKRAE